MRRSSTAMCGGLLLLAAFSAHAGNGNYFHVDDFAGLPAGFGPLVGNHSLWCGKRATAGFVSDGYGNNWNECFESCQFAAGANVTFSYDVHWDMEPSYDFGYAEYLNASNAWVPLTVSGGNTRYNGTGSASEVHVIPSSSLGSTVRLRFRMTSDSAYSDEDGNYPSTGAMTIDNVMVKVGAATVNTEDFECEDPGDKLTRSGKWASGSHAACSMVQPCNDCDPRSDLIINTGFDQGTMAEGKMDPEWLIVNDTDPKTTEWRPATVIANHPAWATQDDSKWLSPYLGANYVPDGTWTFQYRFCLANTAGAALNMTIRCDDIADVFLNNVWLGQTPGSTFLATNLPALFQNGTNFVTGQNVLRVALQNTGGTATGLNIAGTIHGNVQYNHCCTGLAAGLMGTVWLDRANYGVKDANEKGQLGWTIQLSNGATTVTDGLGNYYFLDLPPATYTVSPQPKGWVIFTSPDKYTATLGPGDLAEDLDFGYRKPTLYDFPKGPIINEQLPIGIEPNPFNPATTISFTLKAREHITMKIYDVSGRLLRTLADEDLPPGDHKRDWNGSNDAGQSVSSGVYFLKFVNNGSSQTKKLLIVK